MIMYTVSLGHVVMAEGEEGGVSEILTSTLMGVFDTQEQAEVLLDELSEQHSLEPEGEDHNWRFRRLVLNNVTLAAWMTEPESTDG